MTRKIYVHICQVKSSCLMHTLLLAMEHSSYNMPVVVGQKGDSGPPGPSGPVGTKLLIKLVLFF